MASTEPRDVRDTHERDQREARALETAREVGAFYKALRKDGIPATAAQAMAEAYVAGLIAGDIPREPWQ